MCDHGESALLSKTSGIALIVSTFTNREFGFGFREIIDDESGRINVLRYGKSYRNKEAAIEVKTIRYVSHYL